MIRLFAETAVYNWGSTKEEREAVYPCDDLISMSDDVIFRAVTVFAQPEIVYRWLCQMRAAPYSYDRIDNFGRMSPRTLTPGLENLEKGQEFMRIFRLESFRKNDHVTLRVVDPLAVKAFGELVGTYAVRPVEGGTRLIVKLILSRPSGFFRITAPFLPIGDLIMMRKQLLNLKELAEAQHKANAVKK